LSDGIKRFPPEFDSKKRLPRRYDLDKIDVYVESPPGDYFTINGLPENIGFGKHAFAVYITDGAEQTALKNFSNILFEAKDAAGNIIYSGTSNKKDLNGASVCFIWVKEDPLLTTNSIQDGIGSLTFVGQLENVPAQYNNVYNVRTSFPLNIRTDFLNTSPVLFQSSSKIASDLSITETLEADIDNPNFNKSYANITLKNLETFGGEVDKIQVSYLESGSLSVLEDEEYTLLTQQKINKVSGSFEDDIDFRISKGLNPLSQSFRVVMPPMANQSGSQFGLDDNRFKFKFEFLNKNNEIAKDFNSGEDLNVTSSFVDFVGPATVIGGEGNLIDGQLFLGQAAFDGIEMNAEASAFIRSIGYLGFTSASAGSGSGFMLYSGSVLGANTDDYSSGGVGFEFVSSSEAFMRFNTHPGLFDVKAKSFFVGSENTQFISGSGDIIEISSSKFHLRSDGSVTMSGQLAVEAGGTIGGFTIGETALSTDAFILSSSQSTTDPVSFISSSNFKVSAGGQVTASNIFIEGAIITGSTSIDVDNDIKVKGIKVAGLSTSETIVLGDEDAQITASSGTIDDLTFNSISGSTISASGLRVNGNMLVDGSVTANTFITNVIEQNFSTGDTIFGNTDDDFHRFTGSLSIQNTASNVGFHLTGSDLSVEGNISASGFINIDESILLGNGKGIAFDVNGPNNSTFLGAGKQFAFYSGSDAEIVFNLDSTDRSPKVGIGTTTPGKTLTVEGDISASGGLSGNDLILHNEGGVSAEIKSSTGDSFFRFTDGGSHKFSIGFDNGDSTFAISTGSGLSENQAVTIKSDGKVGIGTTSPQELLHIAGTSDPTLVIQNTGDNQANSGKISFREASATTERVNIRYDGSDNALIIDTEEVSNAFVVDRETGNIGIGVADPDRPLEVVSSAEYLAKFYSTDDLAIVEVRDDDTVGHLVASNDVFGFGGSASLSAHNLNIMTTTGNVGIGTTSPHTELDLVGTASFGDTTDGLMIYRRGNNAFIEGVDKDRSGFNPIQIAANGSVSSPNLHLATDTKVGIGKNNPAFTLDVDGDIGLDGNITSPSFESGFAGSGFKVELDSDTSKYSLTVDDLTVRGQMSVFEMLIHQVRATNGSLFVSNTGRIISASLENASTKQYRLIFDTGSGYGHSFRPGDVIRAQRFSPTISGETDGTTDGDASFKSDLTIESVTGISESLARLTGSNGTTDAPAPGYEYVRIGSTTTGSRQGAIYLTADDPGAPFIDVADGIKKHADFNATGTVKTRMGKLTGITSARFGTLTGYGFYSSGSAFLEGSINADKGSVGGWSISNSIISSSNITLDSTNEKITIQSTTFGDAGVQLENDSGGKFYAGDGSNKFLQFDGTNALIKASNFELDSSGNITATSADLTGKLTSTEGQIGGFALGTTALSSSNFTLSASAGTNELFISHSSFKVKNTGQITGSALLLTASSGTTTNFLQFKDGTLTIRGDVAASSLSTTNFSVDVNGNLTAVSGTIGGFEIDDDEIKAGSTLILDSNTNSGEIKLGGASNLSTGDGIYMNGAGSFRVGDVDGERIKFDSNGLLLSSSKFLIGSDEQFISGSNGKLQIRAQDAILSGSSVSVLAPKFYLGGNSQFISGSEGNIEISSSQFHLDAAGNATFNGDIQVGSQPSQTNLNEGLVLHYNFDQYSSEQQPKPRFPLRNNVEGEMDMIATISTGNGSIEASSGSNAIVNTGLFFSGSNRTKTITLDHDTIDDTVLNGAAKNYSLSFFFKPVNVARAGNPPQQILSAGGSTNGFNAFITSSKIITNFYESNKGSVTSASVANDTMHHLVSTYNNGEAKLYLNSELIQTDNIGVGTISGYSGKLFLGGFSSDQEYYMSSGSAPINFNGTHQTYEGYLDEVRVYTNKVLSQNEVRAIFLNPQANVSNAVNGGQIQAGIIKSLNSSATEGTILNLQEGQLHAGGSGSSARFLFDGTQLRVSASAFFVGSESFISGSGENIEISSSGFHLKPEGDAIFSGSITANDGTIGGFTLGTTKLTTTGFEIGNENVDFALSSSKFQVTHDGQLTGSNVLFNGGKIGGFTISENELSIDNIKLSSVEKGLVISSSQGLGKVLVASGSLSSTQGSTTNHLVDSSFEGLTTDTIITASTATNIGPWYFENDTASGAVTEELWNSGSISMSISNDSAGDDSKHIRISVHKELGPAGTGADEIPT